MDHLHYQEQISQLIDNELPENESPGLFAYLSTCSECREFFQETLQLRSKLAASHQSFPTTASFAEWKSLSRPAYEADVRKPFVSPLPYRHDGRLPGIALMLLMLLVGGLLFSTEVEVQNPQDRLTDVQNTSASLDPFVR